MLPESTCYFGEFVHNCGQHNWKRSSWFDRAKDAVQGCDMVFVDPDNGIAGPNHRPESVGGGKHISLEEISDLASNHPCVGIYHHFDRSAAHTRQMQIQIDRLKLIAPIHLVLGLRYRRISPRAYFLLFRPNLAASVERAVNVLCSKPWDTHFELHPACEREATESIG